MKYIFLLIVILANIIVFAVEPHLHLSGMFSMNNNSEYEVEVWLQSQEELDGVELYLSIDASYINSDNIQFLPEESLDYNSSYNILGYDEIILIGYNMNSLILFQGILLGKIIIPTLQNFNYFQGFDVQYSLYTVDGEALNLASTVNYISTRGEDCFGFSNPFLQLSFSQDMASNYLIYRYPMEINGLEFVSDIAPSQNDITLLSYGDDFIEQYDNHFVILPADELFMQGDTLAEWQIEILDPNTSMMFNLDISQMIFSVEDDVINLEPSHFNLFYQSYQLPGDINQDGALDVLDIVMAVSHIMGSGELTIPEFQIADMNSDGVVDVLDIVIMIQSIIG
jgi:hypothetical protein